MINSAIVKLGKLTYASKVYRGLSGRVGARSALTLMAQHSIDRHKLGMIAKALSAA
mgnify:CR=1 FL=1